MMKRILLIALFLVATPALASTQVFTSRSGAGLNISTGLFLGLAQTTTGGSSLARLGVFAVDGKFTNLRVYSDHTPGGTATVIVKMSMNGVDSALTCTITSAATSCGDPVNNATVTAGQKVTFHITQTNAPAPITLYFTADFTPTTADESVVIFGNSQVAGASPPGHLAIQGNQNNTTETAATSIFPAAGTLDHIYAELESAPGAGNTWTFTVRKNFKSDANLICTIADPATTCNALTGATTTDSTTNINYQYLVPVGVGGTKGGGLSARWVPNTSGTFPFLALTNGTLDTVNTNYAVVSGQVSQTLIEASTTEQAGNFTINKMSVSFRSNPGAAKSWLVTLRKNGADTAMTATCTNTLLCNSSNAITFTSTDTMDVSIAPVGGPGASTLVEIAFVATPTPPPHGFLYFNGFMSIINGLFNLN